MQKEHKTKTKEKNSTKKSITPVLATNSLSSQALRNLVIGVLIASFIAGGISGLLFGTWVGMDNNASLWIQKNVFGQTNAQSSTDSTSVTEEKTITVKENSATIDAVKAVSPTVVSIIITQDLSEVYNLTGPDIFPFDDFFEFDFPFEFEAPQGKQEVGAGTGFIISADGLIITNKHVVSTDGAEYTVVMNDGQQYEAQVLAADPFNDIALIKVDTKDLPIVELGDSDALEIGQTVIAIGNTLGQYQNTVTKGVISGLSRTVTASDGSGQSETLEDIIQTDAAINFGNSGGPLINLDGQVIGVNTAINREGQLIGFAIPINQAKRAIDSVKQHGKIVRPYLGVRYLIINKEIAEKNNLSVNYGALIVRGDQVSELAVIPGSPADKAGLEENDIILEVNGQQIDRSHSLARQLQKYNPGDTVTLKVLHDGDEKIVEATLAEIED
jgi:serine protease Do